MKLRACKTNMKESKQRAGRWHRKWIQKPADRRSEPARVLYGAKIPSLRIPPTKSTNPRTDRSYQSVLICRSTHLRYEPTDSTGAHLRKYQPSNLWRKKSTKIQGRMNLSSRTCPLPRRRLPRPLHPQPERLLLPSPGFSRTRRS